MSENMNQLIQENDLYKIIIKGVYENPCCERKDLVIDTAIESEELDKMLGKLEEEMIILSLTSKADSNIESRVPKKVYMLNPDLESAVQDL